MPDENGQPTPEEFASLQRQLLMVQSLGSAEHPARQYFEAGYSGDLTVDAIKTAATAAGILAAPAAPAADPGVQVQSGVVSTSQLTAPQVDPAQQVIVASTVHDALASGGGGDAGAPTRPPVVAESWDNAMARKKNGMETEQVVAGWLRDQIQGYGAGDRSMEYSPKESVKLPDGQGTADYQQEAIDRRFDRRGGVETRPVIVHLTR